MKNVFVYGTLQVPKVIQAVTGKALVGQPAVLADYARYRVWDACYPGIIAEQGAETRGMLLTQVDAQTLAQLDSFEGGLYTRQQVVVTSMDGRKIEAEAYIIAPDREEMLTDSPWDLMEFLDNNLDDFLEDPGER